MISVINGEIKENIDVEAWRIKGNIYEVLRVINNKPLFLKEHLRRLKRSDNRIDIEIMAEDLSLLLNHTDGKLNNNIFISVNPETGNRGLFIIKGFYPPSEWYENGISINTLEIIRNNPNLKVYDGYYKASIEKHLNETKVFETLITDGDIINEGSRSNVFFIKDDCIFTPSTKKILPGITREKVLVAAKNAKIEIIEKNIKKNELYEYDGVFITGTSIDILPVSKINEVSFSTTDLECFKKIFNSFKKIKDLDLVSYEIK